LGSYPPLDLIEPRLAAGISWGERIRLARRQPGSVVCWLAPVAAAGGMIAVNFSPTTIALGSLFLMAAYVGLGFRPPGWLHEVRPDGILFQHWFGRGRLTPWEECRLCVEWLGPAAYPARVFASDGWSGSLLLSPASLLMCMHYLESGEPNAAAPPRTGAGAATSPARGGRGRGAQRRG
jgi:hypothetical protein